MKRLFKDLMTDGEIVPGSGSPGKVQAK